jgi:hypothetical protein
MSNVEKGISNDEGKAGTGMIKNGCHWLASSTLRVHLLSKWPTKKGGTKRYFVLPCDGRYSCRSLTKKLPAGLISADN